MRTLLKISWLVVIVLSYYGCKKVTPSLGLPSKLITNVQDTALIASTDSVLPNGSAARASQPILFDSTTQKRLTLVKSSNVYVTFVSENASWTNSFGYYTYTGSPSIANKQILFPNISAQNSGGGLKTGDVVQLGNGNFPAGSSIGFYLVAQGWDGSNGKMVSGIYTHYTDSQFNIYPAQDSAYDYHQQSIMYVDKNTGQIIIGFEDMLNFNGDFNDIIISVSDNTDPTTAPTSFDLKNIPVL